MGIQFGASTNFFFGNQSRPPSDQVDFLMTALHEIGHALGFSTQVNRDGTLRGSFNPDDSGGAYSASYDRIVVDEFGNPIALMTDVQHLVACNMRNGIEADAL